jgi:hypothetical protein
MRCSLFGCACAIVGMVVAAPQARAQILLQEFFDTVTNGIPTTNPGWFNQNNSDAAAGAATYFQGNATVFPANNSSGGSTATNAYIGVNFQSTVGTTGSETISNWLVTPALTISNGTVFSFFTRTTTANPFPDRLQVRMSTIDSTNVGTLATDVGDFSTLLLDINPNLQPGPANYPETYTQFNITVSGVPTPVTGRFAFRYFVTDAGPNGVNSNYIGIDDLAVTAPVPEPTSLALVGLGLAGFGWRRWRTK